MASGSIGDRDLNGDAAGTHEGWAAVCRALRAQGIEARAVPVERLSDLRAWFEAAVLAGQLPERVLQELHFGLDKATLPSLSDGRSVRSLIVTASRSPFTGAVFHHKARRFELAIPPTYSTSDSGIGLLPHLARAAGDGFGFAPVRLPAKSLAVFTGLARWGRNNIAYVPGWGSYVTLACFVSDVPTDGDDGWQPAAVLPHCEGCIACARVCPTGAIDGDRLLLHTERCLTFLNEIDDPFPEWLDQSAHTCPVGCSVCQSVCPENAGCEQSGAVSEFSEAETRGLLAGTQEDKLSADLCERLRRCGLLHHLAQLPRNLGVLLG